MTSLPHAIKSQNMVMINSEFSLLDHNYDYGLFQFHSIFHIKTVVTLFWVGCPNGIELIVLVSTSNHMNTRDEYSVQWVQLPCSLPFLDYSTFQDGCLRGIEQ